MNDVPEKFRGDSRIDVYYKNPNSDHVHFTKEDTHVHNKMADQTSAQKALSTEPSADLEARIDGISEEGARLIRAWLSSPKVRTRKVTRQEIINLLETDIIDWSSE